MRHDFLKFLGVSRSRTELILNLVCEFNKIVYE